MVAEPLTLRREEELREEKPVLSTAEIAECTCPEYCERDHETD